MSQWSDWFKTNAIHKTVQDFESQLDTIKPSVTTNADALLPYTRLKELLNLIKEQLLQVNPELISETNIQSINTFVTNIITQLKNYNGNKNVGHLISANSHVTSVLQSMAGIYIPHAKTALEGIDKSLATFRDLSTQHLNHLQQGIKGCDDKLKQYNQQAEQIQNQINLEKSRVDKIIAEFQKQFTAVQGEHHKKFADGETKRESAVVEHLDNYQKLFNTKADELNKKSEGLLQTQKKEYEDLKKQTDSVVDENNHKTKLIIERNGQLQKEIEEQLLKASGGNLFGAFRDRKNRIRISKWVWGGLGCFFLVIQAIFVLWIIEEFRASNYNTLIALRATASIPIVFLIWFCLRQYSNERKYEEVYGFKSVISFSLAPYFDLIKKIKGGEFADGHNEFLIKTVGQIFENPLDKTDIHITKSKKSGSETMHIIESLVRLVEKSSDRIHP